MFGFLKKKALAIGIRSTFDADFLELRRAPQAIQAMVAKSVAVAISEIDDNAEVFQNPLILKHLSETYQKMRHAALGRGATSGADPNYAFAAIMESITLASFVDRNLGDILVAKVMGWCIDLAVVENDGNRGPGSQPFGLTSEDGTHFLLTKPPKR